MVKKDIIEKKISVLKPHYLEIINDSIFHQHHLESPSSGESHYTMIIAADVFDGQTLLKQHKIINNLLKEEFNNGLHALLIKILPKK